MPDSIVNAILSKSWERSHLERSFIVYSTSGTKGMQICDEEE